MSSDPSGLALSDKSSPQSLNLYGYVNNNPLSYIDPWGLALQYNCNPQSNASDVTAKPGSDGSTITQTVQVKGSQNCEVVDDGLGGPISNIPTKPLHTFTNLPNLNPWYKTCSAQAVFKGAGTVAIDSVGLIPEAEGFTKVYENTMGYRLARFVGNSARYRGVVATQYGMKTVKQSKGAVAFVSGAFGLDDTSAQGRISTALTVAGFIPYVGTLAAGASIVNDVIKTGMEVSKCP